MGRKPRLLKLWTGRLRRQQQDSSEDTLRTPFGADRTASTGPTDSFPLARQRDAPA
jgi:hypothetical protein